MVRRAVRIPYAFSHMPWMPPVRARAASSLIRPSLRGAVIAPDGQSPDRRAAMVVVAFRDTPWP